MSTNQIYVVKRDLSREPLDVDKMHRWVDWAGQGLDDVSTSQVALKSHLQFFDGIKTEEIHDTVIKSAADLISEDTPGYSQLAARLAISQIRKKAYGQFEPPELLDHIKAMVEKGLYDGHLLEDYTEKEIAILGGYLDHNRDLNFKYAAVKQLEGKYLVQNRVTGELHESPQMIYMLVSMCLYASYSGGQRMDFVKRFYDAVSQFKISLPTPIMGGVRTPTRQFSSCVLIDSDDSLDSINATASSIVKYVSQRAGIGINAGRIRALGSPIRNGEAFHTGMIPFIKYFQTSVKSCSQGGIRGGAATLFYPLWHLEVENLMVLKNNRGVEENRVRHLDYGVQFNKLMYERMIKRQDITLFSPSDVPGLYEAFFADQDEFERLYLQYEADESIRKKHVPAMELFSSFMQERASTGRIYLMNVDHVNTHGAFNPVKAPVYQSNLCLEITLPTKPLEHVNDPNGEIALCTLSAFNLGEIDDLDELENLAELAVRALDSLLDYQDYPVPAARASTMARRSLGIGAINFANWLAKNGLKYSDGTGNRKTHELFEAIQFYCLKASNELAKERGACSKFHETQYADGKLPVDTYYKKKLDKVVDSTLNLDWDGLREDIVKHGLRNSTLTAMMPSETSSQISNATNGIEPPRGLVSVKSSKDGILKQVVPDVKELRDKYELLWDLPDNKGYLTLVGIMQKFVDQTISANTNYDPSKFPGNKVPIKVLLEDMMYAYQLGVKTLYYHNTRDDAKGDGGKTKADEPIPESSGPGDNDCGDSCVI